MDDAWDFCESDFRDLELHREMNVGVADPPRPRECDACLRELDEVGCCECCGKVHA